MALERVDRHPERTSGLGSSDGESRRTRRERRTFGIDPSFLVLAREPQPAGLFAREWRRLGPNPQPGVRIADRSCRPETRAPRTGDGTGERRGLEMGRRGGGRLHGFYLGGRPGRSFGPPSCGGREARPRRRCAGRATVMPAELRVPARRMGSERAGCGTEPEQALELEDVENMVLYERGRKREYGPLTAQQPRPSKRNLGYTTAIRLARPLTPLDPRLPNPHTTSQPSAPYRSQQFHNPYLTALPCTQPGCLTCRRPAYPTHRLHVWSHLPTSLLLVGRGRGSGAERRTPFLAGDQTWSRGNRPWWDGGLLRS